MGDGDPSSPWLLVSDIDDTLTGDREALERLCDAVSGEREGLLFALNSSRPSASVDATVADYFPDGFRPDATITGMGTEIRVNGEWLEEWRERFSRWPRQEIVALVEGLGFKPHADIYQTPGKASFAVPGQKAVLAVLDRLTDRQLPFESVFSGTSDLDILAPGAGKDRAARFLAEYLGIPPENIVAAGDSGNDLAMFRMAAKSIAVGNARQELVGAMPSTTYHATAHHAAGVHEGLIRFGLLPDGKNRQNNNNFNGDWSHSHK